MSSSYGYLAGEYDAFTGDVDYAEFVSFYEGLFRADGGEFSLLLDLCCGTGSVLSLLLKDGFDIIGSDASPEMLQRAMEKAASAGHSPLLLCQDARELDLYGTVDACCCSLDSINYIPPEDLPEVFRRLHLFIRPGGLFIFDIRSPESFAEMDGATYVDENEDALVLWRADLDEERGRIDFGMDIFVQQDGKNLWRRESEVHTEYLHTAELLKQLLEEAGFGEFTVHADGPQSDRGRISFSCRRI